MQGGPIDSSKWSFQGLLACDFLRRCDSQLRVTITGEKPYPVPHPRPRQHLLLRTRFGREVDGLEHLENAAPRAPGRTLSANASFGSIRRECLDFLIPLNERHLRRILKEWVADYNQGRRHIYKGRATLQGQRATSLRL